MRTKILIGFLFVLGATAAFAQFTTFPSGPQNLSGSNNFTTTIADTLYCKLTGCTMTAATTYSAVANDITTGTNEDLRLRPNGTGAVRLQSGTTNSEVFVENNAGTAYLTMTNGVSGAPGIVNSTNNGTIRIASNVISGSTASFTATEVAFCAMENSTTLLWCAYGGGFTAVNTVQICTCVANAGAGGTLGGVTCDPTSSVLYIANPDTDGCIVTLTETSKVNNARVLMVVQSNAGGVVTIPNVAGVHAGPACATTIGLGLGDIYEVFYATTLNAYQGAGNCADN